MHLKYLPTVAPRWSFCWLTYCDIDGAARLLVRGMVQQISKHRPAASLTHHNATFDATAATETHCDATLTRCKRRCRDLDAT